MSQELFSPVIESERLTLKPIVVDDSDSLLDIFSDPDVPRH